MNPRDFDDVAKKWWQSFTVWFNGVATTAVVLLPELMAQLPIMKDYLPDNYYKWAFIMVVVGNTLIRVFKTKGPVTV